MFSSQVEPRAAAGADPGFFLGGGALVSRSTSTPINHIVFFFRRIPVVLETAGGGVRTPCTLPLDPPLCRLMSSGQSLKHFNVISMVDKRTDHGKLL